MSPVDNDLATDLAALLADVQRPGDFVTSGTAELLAPLITVEGVGPLALPLLPIQAEQLVAAAERAPFGRGPQTLLDTSVRRTWQIDAGRIRIEGRHWQRTLDGIAGRAAEGLGVAGPVVTDLYKLLVYGEGDFFIGHRDTEKAPGMFATLVIVLPSPAAGGELLVRHKGREVRLDLQGGDPSEVAFTAFYADCVHEVLPVTAGHRLALIYNLMRPGADAAPQPPDYGRETGRAAALLKSWDDDEDAPAKLVYPLEHAYSLAELGFGTLKGADAAVAGLLTAAAPQADCDLHLALLSIEENGSADYAGTYGRGGWEDDGFEIGEVFERVASLSDWRRPDGAPVSLEPLPVVEEDELSPPGALDDAEPDAEEFQEATGNAGASFERSYRRAALVLWPRGHFFTVLNQGGPGVTLPYLEELTGRWAGEGADHGAATWRQAHELAGAVLDRWPGQGWSGRPGEPREEGHGRLLRLLTRLGDRERIAALLDRIAGSGELGEADAGAIVAAAGLLEPERATSLIDRIIAGTAAKAPAAGAALLLRAAEARPPEMRRTLATAGKALLDAMPGGPAWVAPVNSWPRLPDTIQPGPAADALAALGLIDPSLADRLAERMLAAPKLYDLDAVILPAVLDLAGRPASRGLAAVARLHGTVLAHLRTRVAEPLEPPADWRRASALPCDCPHCRALAVFLADPTRDRWVLKAAEHQRGHVEEVIRQAKADLTRTTDRNGRPYSLIAVKNQASYERRVAQRRKDLDALAQLGPTARG